MTGQSCGQFDGTIDLLEQDASGGSRRVAGAVHGQALDAGSVEFYAYLGQTPRHHLATVLGDSLEGSWVEETDGGASGTFGAHRETAP